MEQSTLRAFEAQCTQEEPPACQSACPLHVEARAFCAFMAAEKLKEARAVLDRTMPLSGLMGFLCEGDCLEHCRRAEVDGAVNMPLLERACVSLTKSVKPMSMPSSGKRIAVAGAELSSLCLAFELSKKGHALTIFHTGEIGALFQNPESSGPRVLPAQALSEALELLAALRVNFTKISTFSEQWTKDILEHHQALYVGLDDANARIAVLSLATRPADALTLASGHPRIFTGGLSRLSNAPSFVRDAADGKRAAGSITRLLQGVSPAAAREKEGVYATTLYTNISGAPPALPVICKDASLPSQAEAMQEAARCLQCQCLECVKNCAYLARYQGYPKRYFREIYNNLSVVHGLRRTNKQINSCALCGLCAAICPQNADTGAFCLAARQEMVTSKRMPPSAHEFALEDMAFSNGDDIAFFRHAPNTTASAWAFFPGCQLPASMPRQTEQVYAFLRERLACPPGQGVGLFFRCCGVPAQWSGRELLTEQCVNGLRAQWEEAGKPSLILACASCSAFFAEKLPDIPVRSLWDALAELPLPEGAARADQILALHDPCAARYTAPIRAKVRALAASLGQEIEELSLGRELTRCCGYGGLADAADPHIGLAIAKSRAQDTPRDLLAYCAMCRDRLAGTGKGVLHLLDLLFPEQAVAEALARPAPGISERQQTRQSFRQHLLRELWNEKPPHNNAMDTITLHISDELARKLEERRILHADIKTVLLHAEAHGAQFFNPAASRYLSSLRPKQVTFWVEYSKGADGEYLIHDAYCHRMVVPGTPGEGRPTAATLEGCAPKGGRM